MKDGIVYRLTFPSGKVYIGITREPLPARVRRHIANARAGKQFALSAAIRKYGENSFAATVIGSGSWVELMSMEIAEIARSNALGIGGYNMTGGGEGTLCVTQRSETREKISATLSGRKCSDEHKRRVGIAQRGKVLSEATKEKMRAAALARAARAPMSREQRDKIAMALRGRTIPADVVAKRIASRCGH